MRKILLWVMVALFAGLILIVGISAITARSKENHEKKTASTFVNAVLADDATTTYNMFSTSAQNNQTAEDWGTQVDKLSSFFKNQHPSLKDVSTTGTKTAVTYTITGSDGDYVMTVNLVDAKGKLSVESFASLLSLH